MLISGSPLTSWASAAVDHANPIATATNRSLCFMVTSLGGERSGILDAALHDCLHICAGFNCPSERECRKSAAGAAGSWRRPRTSFYQLSNYQLSNVFFRKRASTLVTNKSSIIQWRSDQRKLDYSTAKAPYSRGAKWRAVAQVSRQSRTWRSC